MWSYGAVLFHVVAGAPLWPDADEHDGLSPDALRRLASQVSSS
jgi:hypothetical protein